MAQSKANWIVFVPGNRNKKLSLSWISRRKKRVTDLNEEIEHKQMKIIFNLLCWGTDYFKPKSKKTVAKKWMTERNKVKRKKGIVVIWQMRIDTHLIIWAKIEQSLKSSIHVQGKYQSFGVFFQLISLIAIEIVLPSLIA